MLQEIKSTVRIMMRWFAHCARAGKMLAVSGNVPRWLKAMLVFGLLPIPFCLDEMVLVVAVLICAVFYRTQVQGAWRKTARVYP